MLFVPEGGEPGGCIAARRWSKDACEMKRLFVRDRFRGMGVGRALVEAVIAWARAAGYKKMLLDTLPSMGAAQRLYADFGFRETPPYRFNPVEGARFMELSFGSLKRPAAPRLPSAPKRRRRPARRPPRSPR